MEALVKLAGGGGGGSGHEISKHLTDLTALSATVFVLAVSYLLSLAIYRLYFHPLSHIPGPKLAALTYWYEIYYEFAPPGGQFMFHCRELHMQYGPLVRICPNEVSIQDSSFYHTLYAQSRPWDKPDHLAYRFGMPGASQSTPRHAVHKIRRAALNPFFSKRKIASLAPILQGQIERLCERIAREYRGPGQVLSLNRALGCFTADAVVTVCFDSSYDFAESEGFRCLFVEAAESLAKGAHLTSLFPAVGRALYALPDSVLGALDPRIKVTVDFLQELGAQITKVFESPRPKGEPETMFQILRASNLPERELSVERLTQESGSLVGAGVHTAKWALTVASYHIINTPRIYQRLKAELIQAVPDASSFPPLERLEKLPYLSACIEEGLRLSYGVTQRLHRTSDTLTLQYDKYTLPPQTVIGMDIYSVHHDESIFPDSHSYVPERWLDHPKAPDGKPLHSYMIAFGRGTRSCLGINLAYAELFIGMANLYRRFDFELFETDVEAVRCHRDMFVPFPKEETQGVRVRVR